MEPKTWTAFRDTGLLWWANRTLHLFGWAIVMEENPTTGEIVHCYPARVSYEGFSYEVEELGFRRLKEYLHTNFATKKKETN